MNEVPTSEILKRIDLVLQENKRIETLFLVLTGVLFGCGIACILTALLKGQFAWATPSMVTTGLLYWPLREIKDIRRKNIALATAPMLITQLPPDLAAKEIQKLLKNLYGDERQ